MAPLLDIGRRIVTQGETVSTRGMPASAAGLQPPGGRGAHTDRAGEILHGIDSAPAPGCDMWSPLRRFFDAFSTIARPLSASIPSHKTARTPTRQSAAAQGTGGQ